jgi:hypothetical protein
MHSMCVHDAAQQQQQQHVHVRDRTFLLRPSTCTSTSLDFSASCFSAMPGPLLDVEACQKLIIQNKAAELDAILKKVKPGEIAKPFYQGSEYFAIRYAAESGSADCIKVLLAHGASPNMSVEGDYWPYICTPPLFTAAEKGHPEAVQMLLDGGANPFHKVNGRSAKTMAKGKECTALLKAAEARAKAATAA